MSPYFLAISGLIFTTFIWGITFEIVAESLKGIPPLIFSSIRFFVAFFLIFLTVFIKHKRINLKKNEIFTGFVCGGFLFLGYFFQSYGLWENIFFDCSNPNKSAFITGTSVLMVPIIMIFMGQVNKNIHLWISIFIVLIGLAILLNPDVEKFTVGDLLTFGCALSFATHIIFQGKYIKDIDIYNFFLVQMGTVTLLFICSSFFEHYYIDSKLDWNFTVWQGILITGVLGTFVAILIMVWAQKIVSPIQTAMIFTLEPVFAGVYNHFFTSYKLTNWGIVAGFIIISGILYNVYKVNRT